MELTKEQRIEMIEAEREYRRNGRPEVAENIKTARSQNRYYLGVVEIEYVEEDQPPEHGPGSSHEAWRVYARKVSDFDPEIIETAKKKDLIGMLRANGLAT